MSRPRAADLQSMSQTLGRALGASLAEGIAAGLQGSLEAIREEVGAIGEELAKALLEQARVGLPIGAAPGDPALRGCAEPGCEARAIARGFCRRHYARLVYQERKARQPEGARAPRAARTPRAETPTEPPRPHTPVAPIVRRKTNEADAAAAPATNTTAEPAAPSSGPVTPSSVARFFGLPE